MRRILMIVALTWPLASVSHAVAQPQEGTEAAAEAAQAAGQETGQAAAAEAAAAQEPAADGSAADADPAALTGEQRAQYAAALRQLAQNVRAAALEKMTAKIQAKQAQKMDRIASLISILAFGGGLLLFMPLYLRRRYPNRMGLLFKYSALSALFFYLAVSLFGVMLLLLRGIQDGLGEFTNPQISLLNSTFDLVEKKADEMVEIGPTLIEPTLQALNGETDEPVLSILLHNVQKVRNDLSVFSSIGRFVKSLDWLFGLLPILFVGLAMFLFARAARPTLAEIVRLPERAAQGERRAVRHTLRLTLRNIWAEAKATFCVLGVLIALTLLAGSLLSYVLEPAIEVFLAYLALAFYYIQAEAEASSFWILFSLMGSILFLLLNLVVMIATTILFLAKAQKIFQQRFRDGVPLRAHRRFWGWGTLSAIWTQVLPIVYITVAVKAIGWFVEKSVERFLMRPDPNWPFLLATGPALFLVTFLVVFWIGRGMSALGFLARYKAEGEAYGAMMAAEQAFTAARGT